MVNSQPGGVAAGVPLYWHDAKEELMKRDRIMRKLIPQFGDMCLEGRGDSFTTLARSIIGQQISVKATRFGSLSEMYAGPGTESWRGSTRRMRLVKT